MNKIILIVAIVVFAVVAVLILTVKDEDPDSKDNTSDQKPNTGSNNQVDNKSNTNPFMTKTVNGIRSRADKSSEGLEYYVAEYSKDKPQRIKPVLIKSKLPFVAWQLKLGGSILQHPIIHDGNVYVASNDYQVHCLKTRNGSIVFNYPIASQPIGANLFTHNNTLIVAQRNGAVDAIDLKSGKKKWHHRSDVDKSGNPLDISISGIAINKDNFYTSKHWGNVYIGDLKSGYTTETPGVIYESRVQLPTVFYKDSMIFTNVAGELHSFDGKGTKENWVHYFEKGYLLSLVESDGSLYGINNQKELIRFDLETKSIKWTITLNDLGYQSLAIKEDIIYIGAGNLYAINKQNGKILWQKEKESKEGFKRPITVIDKTIYCTEQNGLVYTINAKDGKVLKRWDVKEPIWSGITYDKGLIFVPTISKHLIVIKTY